MGSLIYKTNLKLTLSNMSYLDIDFLQKSKNFSHQLVLLLTVTRIIINKSHFPWDHFVIFNIIIDTTKKTYDKNKYES